MYNLKGRWSVILWHLCLGPEIVFEHKSLWRVLIYYIYYCVYISPVNRLRWGIPSYPISLYRRNSDPWLEKRIRIPNELPRKIWWP